MIRVTRSICSHCAPGTCSDFVVSVGDGRGLTLRLDGTAKYAKFERDIVPRTPEWTHAFLALSRLRSSCPALADRATDLLLQMIDVAPVDAALQLEPA